MTSIDLKLSLPDELAREAQQRGLLDSAALAEILREELCHRRVDALFAAADRLAGSSNPPLTDAEIESVIQVARTAQRTSRSAAISFK